MLCSSTAGLRAPQPRVLQRSVCISAIYRQEATYNGKYSERKRIYSPIFLFFLLFYSCPFCTRNYYYYSLSGVELCWAVLFGMCCLCVMTWFSHCHSSFWFSVPAICLLSFCAHCYCSSVYRTHLLWLILHPRFWSGTHTRTNSPFVGKYQP